MQVDGWEKTQGFSTGRGRRTEEGKLPLEKGQRVVCAACLSFAGRVDSRLRRPLKDHAQEEDLDGRGKSLISPAPRPQPSEARLVS